MERCSAALLPYLEGDFWPGEAENLLLTSLDGGGGGKGGGGRKGANKGKRFGLEGGGVDQQLMSKLGETLGAWVGWGWG